MKCNVDGSECDMKIQHGEGGRVFSTCHLTATSARPYPTHKHKCTQAVM